MARTLSVAIKSVCRKFLSQFAQCNVCIITIVSCSLWLIGFHACIKWVGRKFLSRCTHCNCEHDYTVVCTIMIRFYDSYFFNYFVQKRAVNYDVTLNKVSIITTVSGKKDKTRKYSLSSSTALLVVCRHANDGGGDLLLVYSTFPPG